MKKIFVYALIIYFFPAVIFPQESNKIKFKTLNGSKVWIEGTSTINDFICGTQTVEGNGYILETKKIVADSTLQENILQNNGSLIVKVFTLDCGKEQMNDDMLEAMKADEFPFIKFELTNAEGIKKDSLNKDEFNIKVTGNLTISGKSNLISMVMDITKLQNKIYRVKGSRDLLMKDFDITPPSALWGLIKAHDEIVVHFDLIVARIVESQTHK